MKKALITGITGQDGAYLAQLLLEKGYKVYGGYRRSAGLNLGRLQELGVEKDVELVTFELLEYNSILRAVTDIRPDEIYNLAAQSFVAASFREPIYAAEVNGVSVLRLLEVIRTVDPAIKFYQASTSEMFGMVQEVPQRETTPFYPRSPYAIAKLYAHWATINCRESYALKACNGILFNHESPLRGEEFVTRKITSGFARVKGGLQDFISLGNLNSKRDWGFAGDYVVAMWKMLQQSGPFEDFVIATGETHSIREFIEIAGATLDYDVVWEGNGRDEVGRERKTGKILVKIDPQHFRPAEVDNLRGNAMRAFEKLDWKPKVQFKELVTMMVEADIRRIQTK